MPSRRLLLHHHSSRHHHLILAAEAAVAAASVLVVAALVLLVIYHCRRRRLAAARTRTAPSSPPSAVSDPNQPLQRFTYEQLRRATAGFSPANKLGQGGFGSVFGGVLPSGKPIAAKLMESGSFQGEIEFQNELELAARTGRTEHVVFPVGFCSDEDEEDRPRRRKRKRRRRRKRRNWFDDIEDDEVEVDGGDNVVRRRILVLVYDLMENGSLQDALLVRKSPELMEWKRRFDVILDVARGLQFLHIGCDPPVVHGDIKASNILLDLCFRAKIADFGLARLLTTATGVGVVDGNGEGDGGIVVIEVDGEDNGSVVAVETESVLAAGFGYGGVGVGSPEGEGFGRSANEGEEGVSPDVAPKLEVASVSETVGLDKVSMDSGIESRVSCKDWWWRQDGEVKSESGAVKDYVMEWIGSEIGKERPTANWGDSDAAASTDDCQPIGSEVKRKQSRRSDWWASLDGDRLKRKKDKTHPTKEWWREEFCEELSKKNQKKKQMLEPKASSCTAGGGSGGERQWWRKGENSRTASGRSRRKLSWSRGSRGSVDWRRDGPSTDSRITGCRSSHDWASGEIPKSGGVSSTPSMRGTMCYAAPESGGELLSEKSDIYSFGVLLLVIISGRRPLQVTASPMLQFERANLISWARHLARKGNLLDLVDSSLVSVDQEQVLLCIMVSLLCLQRSPDRRPPIKEVMGMLSGDSEPPRLPLELSQSPNCAASKSRKKAR